jgi:hypothetical protein
MTRIQRMFADLILVYSALIRRIRVIRVLFLAFFETDSTRKSVAAIGRAFQLTHRRIHLVQDWEVPMNFQMLVHPGALDSCYLSRCHRKIIEPERCSERRYSALFPRFTVFAESPVKIIG